MYVESLKLTNVRTFVKNELRFIHPDTEFRPRRGADGQEKWPLPKPKLPNVNLLLGDNGSGKSTVLQATALASLGPAAYEAQLPLPKFVRFRKHGDAKCAESAERADIEAALRLHEQDRAPGVMAWHALGFVRRGELEGREYFSGDSDERESPSTLWKPVFESKNDAFFCVAYGATRRVDSGDSMEPGQGRRTPFVRGQRLQSILQDSFALFPLPYWLPELQSSNPGRYKQVVNLLNRMLGPGNYCFTGAMRERDYLFERGGVGVPFRSLSDGYRAFVAWVADLLYHICYGCPSGKKLVESAGVVLVDEIDLHLHPKWQMKVIRTVAKALPRMQFIFTSHSPLIAGSLEWMNIITLKTSPTTNRTVSKRLRQSIHGLDADQILLTDFFGLKTTRAKAKAAHLDTLRKQARSGDREAARKMILAMAQGTEEDA